MGTRLLDKSVATVHTPTDAIGSFNHKRKPPSVIIFLYIWCVIAHLPTLKFFCRGCLCTFQDWASISPTDFGIEPLTHHICGCPLYLSSHSYLNLINGWVNSTSFALFCSLYCSPDLVWNSLWLSKVFHHWPEFMKPENRQQGRCRSPVPFWLVPTQTTWAAVCLKSYCGVCFLQLL